MYKNKKIIAIIPARGGSKRVPRKNIKPLAGKPLIFYAINAALKSKYLDRVIVSTDDREIAKVAEKFGAEIPFLRPKELATDKARSIDALKHAVRFLEKNENYKADIIVLIQPTTPLVSPEDIDKTIEKLIKARANSCVTMAEISERPEWMYKIGKNGKAKLFWEQKIQETRSQDLPKLFRLNGAVYAVKKDVLMKKNKILDNRNLTAVIMPADRSIDIDEPVDFKIVECLINFDAALY